VPERAAFLTMLEGGRLTMAGVAPVFLDLPLKYAAERSESACAQGFEEIHVGDRSITNWPESFP
jgi:hypothetical protein